MIFLECIGSRARLSAKVEKLKLWILEFERFKNFSFSSIFLHLFKELMLNWNPVI